jgi:hypothetical protein
MALQLEAALRRSGPPASLRPGASAEPQAARRTEPRFGAEPREPRSRFLDRATQSRSSAAFAPSRAKPANQPPADAGDSPAATPTDAAETAPEPANGTAHEPAKEESAAPVETSEPAETQRASLEEEMANLLGRASGKP